MTHRFGAKAPWQGNWWVFYFVASLHTAGDSIPDRCNLLPFQRARRASRPRPCSL